MISEELKTRKRLGVPESAEMVIIFGESSHWDPNWLFTSKEYFRLRIGRIFDQAIDELEKEKARVFSIECVFFLKMYWERRPEKRERVRKLVNEGRLRLTGSGMTTPDTLVPGVEQIIRDYVLGRQWLRENGMDQKVRVAYLPDDFGHSPTVPSILSSLGVTGACVTRIDGSFFPGADYRPASDYPLPGSSAELLYKEMKTADFVWRGPDGSEVICHWNPFTYFQGDTIASVAPARWMGITFGFPARSGPRVAKKIKGYASQLAPLSRTPYMFCPIGCDFNGPVKGLAALLDKYNREYSKETGVHAVLAGLDDYLELVSCYRDRLPNLALDLNPYWTGFYSARPEIKQRCANLADTLLAGEARLAMSGPDDEGLERNLNEAWQTAVVANHHDFITGTSPDRVWKKEQRPWLIEAQEKADSVLARLGEDRAKEQMEEKDRLPGHRLEDGRLEVETGHYRIVLDERRGGCITAWETPDNAFSVCPGNDVVVYRDSGGLWRMGHEFRGGTFKEIERASKVPASIQLSEEGGALVVTVISAMSAGTITRVLRFVNDSPVVAMRLSGRAAKRTTVTARFSTSSVPSSIYMDVPGGVVERPCVKIFDPTFWPALSFAQIRDAGGGGGAGFALFMGGPAAVSGRPSGIIEAVALRNAPKEQAFGFLPVLGHPAYGEDNVEHDFDYAVMATNGMDWKEARLHSPDWDDIFPWAGGPGRLSNRVFDDIVKTGDDVRVLALKRAHHGDGVIVRLQSFGPSATKLLFPGRKPCSASLCDSLENDLYGLEVSEDGIEVPLERAVITVRVVF